MTYRVPRSKVIGGKKGLTLRREVRITVPATLVFILLPSRSFFANCFHRPQHVPSPPSAGLNQFFPAGRTTEEQSDRRHTSPLGMLTHWKSRNWSCSLDVSHFATATRDGYSPLLATDQLSLSYDIKRFSKQGRS